MCIDIILDVVLDVVLGAKHKILKRVTRCLSMSLNKPEGAYILQRARGPGMCGLCGKSQIRLERHHIRYRPEVTIDVCHQCHFKITFFKYQLTERELQILLCRIYKPETIEKYKQNLVRLYNLSLSYAHGEDQKENLEIAPSRAAFLSDAKQI